MFLNFEWSSTLELFKIALRRKKYVAEQIPDSARKNQLLNKTNGYLVALQYFAIMLLYEGGIVLL